MSRRNAVLRRLDFAARGVLLAAGLLAQWAMWIVGHAWVYPGAGVVLVALSVESARRPFVAAAGARLRAGADRRRRNAYRIVACVALAGICVGIAASLPSAGAVPMAVPIGVLLLTVQGAQVQTMESRRDAMIGGAVVMAMLVDAGFFAHDARPTVAVLSALLCLLIAAALLQRGSVLARTRDAIELPRSPVLRTLLVPATTAVVIGALAFLALPNSLQLGTRNNIGPLALGAAGNDAAAGRATLDPGAARLDLRVRGALSDQQVFAVAANTPAYWQGAVFDTFDGTSWTTTGAATDPQPVVAEQAVRTDTVRVLSTSGLDVVVAPGTPTAYSGPGQMVATPDGAAFLRSGATTPPWGYQVSSTSSVADATTLRDATGSDPNDPKWTAVEPGLPARVRGLAAQLTASAPTRYEAVSAVDTYLQTHEVYDLTSPVPAVGQDAVDDFLFVSHRGFCEQFASAAVIMLRSTGIPARLVTGYSHGDLNSAAGQRVMRGMDAHAWIQVWYPGVGWVDSDPTAQAVLPSATVATSAPDRRPLAVVGALRIRRGGRLGGRLGWLVALGCLIAIGVAAALLVDVIRRRRPENLYQPCTEQPRPGDGPVLQAYARLDAALGAQARGQAREPAQTLREVAQQLDADVCSRTELVAALNCLERECYATTPPASAEVATAVEVFERLHAALGSGALSDGVLTP